MKKEFEFNTSDLLYHIRCNMIEKKENKASFAIQIADEAGVESFETKVMFQNDKAMLCSLQDIANKYFEENNISSEVSIEKPLYNKTTRAAELVEGGWFVEKW